MKTTTTPSLLVLCLALAGTALHAQSREPSSSLVSLIAEARGLPLMKPDHVPIHGTYWVIEPWGINGVTAEPYPFPPFDLTLPIYAITPENQAFLVDGTVGTQPVLIPSLSRRLGANYTLETVVEAQANLVVNLITQVQTAQANLNQDGYPAFTNNFISYTIDTNLLWLQITNISDGTVYANMYQATDYVYAVWSTTNLAMPFADWQVETEVFPTNTNCMPFTVSQSGRPDLFLRGEDWTGVTANGNETPLWWLYYYFGNTGLELLDTNLDVWGSNTLVFDYTNGIAPTDYYNGSLPALLAFSGDQQSGPLGAFLPQPLVVQVTDGYGNGLSSAPLTFSVSSGVNQLAATNGGTLVTNLNVTTDSNGLAEAWLFLPTNAPEVNYATVTAQSGPYATQIYFTAYEGEAATPDISPAGGAFTVIQSVAVSSSTTGAIMHYTLDGSDPTEDDPAATNGQTLLVPWTSTLNVAAFDDGILLSSEVQSANFTIIHPLVAGREHTMILNPDETIIAAGSNGSGQLGNGTTTDRTNLVGMLNLTNAVGIAAGALHSLAWGADGSAWAWGDNSYGQLGDGQSSGQQSGPTNISGLSGIIQMAGGYQHSLALDANNYVWAWGNNASGQLGDGTTSPEATPEKVIVLSNIVEIAAGGEHSLALAAGESVQAWGNNNYGQLGDGTTTERTSPVTVGRLTNALAIAAGFNHSLALASDETVLTWGNNTYGQLGDTTLTERNQPVHVIGVSNIVAIAAGEYHNLALKSDGTVWSWGYNSHGQLGDGTTTTRTSPVPVSGLSNVLAIAAGWAHSAALKSDGAVVVWGSIPYGLNGDASASFSTVPVTEEPSVLVNWQAPTITVQPFSQEVLAGDDVTFDVVATGTNLTYQWNLEGTPIPGATASVYTINNVQSRGDYTVTVGTGLNSVVSSNAVLTVGMGNGDPHFMVLRGQRLNYTFKSGVTYVIASPVQLYGATTINAGAVVKFNYNSQLYDYGLPATLKVMGSLHCPMEPYNPAILTSVDDDASGEFFWWESAGPLITGLLPVAVPTGAPYLDLSALTNATLGNLRIAYADEGVTSPSAGNLDIWDCQFIHCNSSVMNQAGGTNGFHNVLFAGCGDAVRASTNNIAITAEHVTADVSNFWDAATANSSVRLTNSIVLGGLGAASMQSTFVKPSPTNFQATDVGNYYLAPNSPLHNTGSMNVSSRLLTEFQKKTTYPPMSFPALMQLNGSLMLCPQAPRYTNGAPDIGYYYDALDYTVADLVLNGGSLTVEPGTAVGLRMEYVPQLQDLNYIGFDLQNGSTLLSQGTPNKPTVFVDVQSVQEQFEIPAEAAFVPDFFPDPNGNGAPPTLNFRFSNFYVNYAGWLGAPAYHFWSGISADGLECSVDSAMNFTLRDCQLHGGQLDLGLPDNPDPYIGFGDFPLDYVYGAGVVSWINNSFENVAVNLEPTYNQCGWDDPGTLNVDFAFTATNNLFRGGDWFWLEPVTSSSGNWVFADNLFDKVDFLQDTNQPLDYNHNAYWPLRPSELLWVGDASQLQPTTTGDATTDGGNEPVLSNAPPYQVGPFGHFYLPTNTPLYGAASDTATNLGLFHYTTRGDQVEEGNDVVAGKPRASIGLHYIAATNGVPMDFDGDGIPDYVENWHGDGNYPIHTDNETDWQNPTTATNPVSGLPIPDAYNTTYDNEDLDGDGLPGLMERFLATNPLVPDNQLTLPPFQSVSGLIDLPFVSLPSVISNAALRVYLNGQESSSCNIYQAGDGTWHLQLDSMTLPNGGYILQLALSYAEDGANWQTALGSACVFQVTNSITVDPLTTIFTDSLYIGAAVNVPADYYEIDIYDVSNNLLNKLTGAVQNNYISDGWNLNDTNGNLIVSGPLRCNFYLTSSSSQTAGPMIPNVRTGPAASAMYHLTTHITGKQFAVALASYRFPNSQTVVSRNVIIPLCPGDGLGPRDYTFLPNQAANTPLSDNAFVWYGGTNGNKATLTGALDNRNCGCFYWQGHGGPNSIGVSTNSNPNDHLTYSEVMWYLMNQGPLGTNTTIYNQHPFRLVILDACQTWSWDWARTFGIPFFGEDTKTNYEAHGLDSCAYVGWTTNTDQSHSVDAGIAYGTCLNVLFSTWLSGYPLKQCLYSFNYSITNSNLQPPPSYYVHYFDKWKIAGCADLTTRDR